jgi:hypothetical protein
MHHGAYQQTIESLIYAVVCIHIDLTFIMWVVFQHSSNLGSTH